VVEFENRRGFDLGENLKATELAIDGAKTHTGLVIHDALCFPQLLADLVEHAAELADIRSNRTPDDTNVEGNRTNA
jgi:hypothetical protein